MPLLLKVDAVTFRVPSLEEGLRVYRDQLGHDLLWRNEDLGQAGLRLPDSDTEIVLATEQDYEPNWLVHDVDEAAQVIISAGGKLLMQPADIPVGRVALVQDPFGNTLTLVELSKGRYIANASGTVTGVE